MSEKKKTPPHIAHLLYAHLFPASEAGAQRAAAEWAEVPPSGQRYMLAHLTYLLLQELGRTTGVVEDIADEVDAIGDLHRSNARLVEQALAPQAPQDSQPPQGAGRVLPLRVVQEQEPEERDDERDNERDRGPQSEEEER